jgi:hypothetical protein
VYPPTFPQKRFVQAFTSRLRTVRGGAGGKTARGARGSGPVAQAERLAAGAARRRLRHPRLLGVAAAALTSRRGGVRIKWIYLYEARPL